MVSVWVYGIRQQGARGYFGHFFANGPLLAPLNIIEELIKPVTLALRLFGNIFAGGIMLALIGLLPIYVLWAPNLIWKLFDMAIGGIQAFIFALLTVLYFSMAGAGHGDDHAEEHADEHDQKTPVPASLTTRSARTRGKPDAPPAAPDMRRESHGSIEGSSSWPVPSSVVASPSPAARSVPVSVTVWPVRPTSRASPASPRPRVDSRRSSS